MTEGRTMSRPVESEILVIQIHTMTKTKLNKSPSFQMDSWRTQKMKNQISYDEKDQVIA